MNILRARDAQLKEKRQALHEAKGDKALMENYWAKADLPTLYVLDGLLADVTDFIHKTEKEIWNLLRFGGGI